MTERDNNLSVPSISFIQTDQGFVLKSERSSRLSSFFVGQPVQTTQMLLVSLMGLCPIAHYSAFGVAVRGEPNSDAYRYLAIEAMLESVRVFCVDWKRFAPADSISEFVLENLGRLRQSLFEATLKNDQQTVKHLLKETQQFVRFFQDRYRLLFRSLFQRSRIFEGLPPLPTKVFLSPSELGSSTNVRKCLSELSYDREFAVKPRLNGLRLLGALARSWNEKTMGNTWKPSSILAARWMELSIWSYSEDALRETFLPTVHVFSDGWQVALVETLRGTLMHALKVQNKTVEDFHIVAPTEWIFQDNGFLLSLMDDFVAHWGKNILEHQDDLEYLVALFDACTDIHIQWSKDHA